MLPSRGLHLARGHAPLLIRQPCRHLSSTPRPLLRSTCHRTGLLAPTSTPWTRSTPTAIPSIAAIRHASTTPTPTDPATAPLPPTSSFPELDTITLDDIPKTAGGIDISSIPEGLGYLKQIGLDYGYGPTSMIEWVLEHMHIWAGLPWWGAIAATAVALRVVTFPLHLKSSDIMARQNALTSVTKPITDRMSKAQKEGNTPEVVEAYKQLRAVRKRAGISMPQQLTPLALQGVFGYCGFKLMRAASELPVPGFRTGGLLWLQDLTLTDGYLLMPVIMAGTVHMMVRLGGETGSQTQLPEGMKKVMLWGMPATICILTAWQSGAVCVWFAASGALGIIQAKALQQPAVRKFFGLAPLWIPKPGEGGGFLTTMLEDKLKDMQPNRPAPSAGANGGRNAAYMAPSYQSPNINRQGKTIDTTLVDPNPAGTSAPSAELIQPGVAETPKKGVFDALKDKFQGSRGIFKSKTTKTPEQRMEEERRAFKRRAQQYEQKAQQRGRR